MGAAGGGRLLADLGHEMRTPLATLEAYLEALEDGVATLDASTADLLRSQTWRLARLSEDIGAAFWIHLPRP